MTIAVQTAKAHGRIGGVRLTVRRGARSAPSTLPASAAGSPALGRMVLDGIAVADLLYVRDRGWTPQQQEHWTYDVLHAQLCAD